jgi:cytochrome c oxidase cbb3-type subunit 3
MMRGLAAVLLAAAAILLAGSSARSAIDAASLHERGRAVYNFRCYFCHGYSGDAKTVAAGLMAVKPRDFTRADPGLLDREKVLHALRHGRPGTPMASFEGILDAREMEAVAAFVVNEFVTARRPNTRYHTAENGWPDHERFRDAFRFVRDPAALALPPEQLDEADQRGRRLYLATCVSCHDAPHATGEVAWDARPVSYPLDGHDCVSCHDRVRYPERGLAAEPPPASYHGASRVAGLAAPAVQDDSPYAAHDQPVALASPTAEQRRGEALYLKNCAFCHAADGTARHWIGRFLEPHPRDLTEAAFRARFDRDGLVQRIEEGLPGTAMPTWRNVLKREEIRAIAVYMEAAFGPLGGGPR